MVKATSSIGPLRPISTTSADPIYAAIERHRIAERDYGDILTEQGKLEQERPHDNEWPGSHDWILVRALVIAAQGSLAARCEFSDTERPDDVVVCAELEQPHLLLRPICRRVPTAESRARVHDHLHPIAAASAGRSAQC
jgi:hypothetical protein